MEPYVSVTEGGAPDPERAPWPSTWC